MIGLGSTSAQSGPAEIQQRVVWSRNQKYAIYRVLAYGPEMSSLSVELSIRKQRATAPCGLLLPTLSWLT